DLILRSTVWLTVKESRASFMIEREQDKEDRIRRFAAVMENECGRHDNPLTPETLSLLQRGILGDMALRYGLRRSPVYV
ncbi:cell filamentation protein Fic, partial [Acinetobacter baumannii]